MKVFERYHDNSESLQACPEMVPFPCPFDRSIFWFVNRRRWGDSAFMEHRLRTRGADTLMHQYYRCEVFSVPVSYPRCLYTEAPPGRSWLESQRELAVPTPSGYAYFLHLLLNFPRASESRVKDSLLRIALSELVLFFILAVLEASFYGVIIYSRNPDAALYAQAGAWSGDRCGRLLSLSDAVLDAVEAFGINEAVHDTDYAGPAKDVFRWIWRLIWSEVIPFCGYS